MLHLTIFFINNFNEMSDMSNFNKVKTFMNTYGQEVKNTPEFPDSKIVQLRIDLIQEELKK